MYVVASQNAFHNMDAHFGTGLHDNLTDPLPHRALQNFVPIFRDPHDVKSVVESRVSGPAKSRWFRSIRWKMKVSDGVVT